MELCLKNTFLLRAMARHQLLKLCIIAGLGMPPSPKLPSGLVLIEGIASKIRVFGGRSGVAKGLASTSLRTNIADPLGADGPSTLVQDERTLSISLQDAIRRALKEEWQKIEDDDWPKFPKHSCTAENRSV